MARCWVNLLGVSPLLLGIMIAVPQMAASPLVLAQSGQTNQNSQAIEAQRLYNEGERLRQQGTRESLQQALARFQQALPLFRANGDRSGEADNLDSMGIVSSRLGQTQQALNFYRQALPLWREVGGSIEERLRRREGEAGTLYRIGIVYSNIGQPQEALNFYQQALSIRRSMGDSTEVRLRQRPAEAGILNNIGVEYNNIGQQQQALNFYQQALSIRREVGDREGESITLNNIGNVYADTGQLQQALNYYQQALPIRREVGNRAGEANILNNMGTVYTDIGQAQLALNYFQQALLIRREVGDRSGVAGVLNNIGSVYRNMEQPQQALNFYQQALPIIREVGDRNGEAKTLINIGNIYIDIGQPQQALTYYQQALPIRREVGDRAGEARTLSNMGSAYSGIGQQQQALNFHQQSLAIFREVSDRAGEAATLHNLASVQKTLTDLPTALANIQAAIAIVEDIRGQLISPEFRTSYFATVQDYYKLQIDLLMELHQKNPDQSYAAQAFNVTERSKARTLLELLAESKADIRTGVDPQLLAKEKDIQSQLVAIDKRRIQLASSTTKEQITALENQRQTLQSQYRDLQTQIRTTSPKYAALKYPQPLALEQIQQQILDDNTLILSYSLGKDKSYLWLISKTEMSSYELPNKKIIENLINTKVRSQLTNPRTSRNTFLRETSELSNILLKPILEKTSNKRLAIIGDGALQYLPFGALPDPRAANNQYQPLLVNNQVIYLPSASTLQTIRNENQSRTPASKTLAVIADPVFTTDDPRISQSSISATNPAELPLAAQNLESAARGARGDWDRLLGTRREANTILNLVPENSRLAYFDFQANRANALSNLLSQYRFIHWATHGFANLEKAELSGIVMSLVNETGQQQDGYLLLGDIFNLSFNADLVVLSACETGKGEVVRGEGLIGLTRGLMYAGTPRVVTSLWAVPDSQTADLMGKFYEKMLQQNLRPAEALRAAQLEMFNSRSWMAPYYWAAFTLQGEWL